MQYPHDKWQQFTQSGKIADYLSYRDAYPELPEEMPVEIPVVESTKGMEIEYPESEAF